MEKQERDKIAKEVALKLYFSLEDRTSTLSMATLDFAIKKYLGYPTSVKLPHFTNVKIIQIREGMMDTGLVSEEVDDTGVTVYRFNPQRVREVV